MDQLELVFRLLVHLQLMYLQYNVYLSIVVRTYINIYIYTHVIQNNLRTPQLAGFARQLGCKNASALSGSTGTQCLLLYCEYHYCNMNIINNILICHFLKFACIVYECIIITSTCLA